MKPTLAELEAMSNEPTPPPTPPKPTEAVVPPPPAEPAPPPVPPIKGGDGSTPPADIEAERQRQAKAVEEEATRKLATEAANVAAGKNPDGTEMTAEQKAAILKEDQDEEDDLAVWEEVDKLWGAPLKVEYKDDAGVEVHPNSPQGIMLRERAIADRAIAQFDEHLEKTDPRAYAYLLHRQAGGDDKTFFETKTVTLPVYEEFQNSVDLRTKVYAEHLRIKGLGEDQVKLLVDAAVRDKKIDALSDAAYKSTENEQTAEIARLAEKNKQEQERYNRSIQVLSKNLTDAMTGEMSIIIPDAKKVEFNNYVRQHIQVNDGQFFIAQPIDPKHLGKQLDMLYFRYANGNMGELVQREAETKNTIRLRRSVERSKQTPVAAETLPKRKLTLGEL